ncbi:hypothetical protein RIF29_17856 [Crotalaria pallida]|uniref:Uncharacterized protein n=1 Tax=Crotalaria pallida TaxID=3830 RepID=A0AAN9FK62_CROPI
MLQCRPRPEIINCTPTKVDRVAARECLKAAADTFHGIKEGLVVSLPKQCGIDVGFTFSKDIDCKNINIPDSEKKNGEKEKKNVEKEEQIARFGADKEKEISKLKELFEADCIAEKQKANQEKGRADAMVVKAESQKALAEDNCKKFMEEKRCADKMSQQLELRRG